MSRRDSQTVLVLCVAVAGFVFGLFLFVLMDRQGDSPEAVAKLPLESGVSTVGPKQNTQSSPSEDLVDKPDPVQRGKPSPPMLAIIVDDFGYGRSGTTSILDLPYSLTVSVLPNLHLTRSDYEKAVASKHQVMLHLPMEPSDDSVSPGEGAILVGMTEEEIRSIIDESLAQVPEASAVNNHMGSKATADESTMRVVLSVLKERGIYWVDSSTTPQSKGPSVSRSLGMPVVINNMFLDWESTREYIEDRLLDAAQRARDRGYAVAIGHVSRVFAETLQAVLPRIASSGVTLVTVDQLVEYLASTDEGQELGQPAGDLSHDPGNG